MPQNGSYVDITGSTFQQNKAGVTGGALRVQVSALLAAGVLLATCLQMRVFVSCARCHTLGPLRCQMTLTGMQYILLPPARLSQGSLLCTTCTFLENKAPLGGAVGLGRSTWAAFQGYTFQLNTGVRAGSECWTGSTAWSVPGGDSCRGSGVGCASPLRSRLHMASTVIGHIWLPFSPTCR